MRHNSVRLTVCLLLALLMLLPLAACSKPGEDSSNTSDAAATSGAPEQTENKTTDEEGYLLDTLPEKLNFGKEITVLWDTGTQMPDFFVEEESGEAVNDAIWKRNSMMEERLGVKLKFAEAANDKSKYLSTAEADFIAGDNLYAIYGAYSRTIPYISSKLTLMNLLESDYFNAQMPWWPSSLTEQLIINNKLFMCSGDISTMTLWQMSALYYNKDMWKDRGYDYTLENTVEAGEWTVDKLIGIVQDCYIDDGDGKVGLTDSFGLVCYNASFDAMLNSAGIVSIIKNAEGKLEFSEDYYGEKGVSLVEKLGKMCKMDAFHQSGTQKDERNLFFNGQSLFILDGMYLVTNNQTGGANIDFSYGLIPCPKYDTDQKNYITGMRYSYTMYAVNGASAVADEASAVVECLGSYGYRFVSPMIFELTMKTRYSSDEQSSRMFDILRAGVCFDIGRIYNYSMNNFYPNFRNVCFDGGSGWAALNKAISKVLPGQLDAILDFYS